jgi:hypothetical protein
MAKIKIPFLPQVHIREVLNEEGCVRLAELEEELEDMDREELYPHLMELVEQGDVAIFPVGDTVQVRDDS